MPYFPILNESAVSQQVTDIFRGYNHNLKIMDGEFYEMRNLTSDFYPLLANRDKRGRIAGLSSPQGMLAKAQLAYVDNRKLFYGNLDITGYLTAAGFGIRSGEKQLVSMGAYIIIYPDKLYINTENYTDCGSIEARFSQNTASAAASYEICDREGAGYEGATVAATAPEEPENSDLWIDTSGTEHSLKRYNAGTSTWVQVATVYTKISCKGIGAGFNQFDGVEITGCAAAGEDLEGQIDALNGSKIIYAKGDDYIVVVGLLDRVYTQKEGTVSVARTMPDMDFITEAENRLWGCKYGFVEGVGTVNELYCCALGDFKNWSQYLGLSTDSWRASVGTDGQWTGAVTHLGYPVFFKENCLHKIYISSSGAHQVIDTACRGVQKGSHRSLVVVNEHLYYKGRSDVCVYDGSLPVSVSDQLGDERYYNAVAGSVRNKYFISMQDAADGWHLFVYDTERNLWHREDNTHAAAFARYHDDLYFIDGGTGDLMCVYGTEGTPEASVEWSATTGLIGYNHIEQQYVSRFNMRMKLPEDSWLTLYIEYDSDGEWHEVGDVEGMGTKTFLIPVRPRRCDHFRIRMEGAGDVRLYSLAKIHESGSDEQWV